MCGLDYSSGAAGAWVYNSGGTPSYSTGPSGDSSVNGTGYYLHVEASNNYPDVGPYTITTPVYTSCVGQVTFDYHMYGSWMGSASRYLDDALVQDRRPSTNTPRITG